MPGTLLLFIPDSASFDPSAPLSWTRVDGASVMSGRSVLAETPRADRVVAVAPVARILYLETLLPPVSRAKRNALLNYAIEDKLTIDPDTVHATVLAESRDAEHVVAVVDKQWLSGVINGCRQADRLPRAMVCEADVLTARPGEWMVAPGVPHGFARRDDGFVLHLDAASVEEIPFALGLALNEARQKGRSPSALGVVLPKEAMPKAAALCEAWQSALGVPVRAQEHDSAAALALVASRANLLTGEFAPRQERSGKNASGRLVAALLAAMVLVHLAFTAIDNARMKSERESRFARMAATFRTLFPETQAVVDAPLQMQRKLAELRRERGIAQTDPARRAIEAMAAFAARDAGLQPPPELMSMSLAEGRMRTKWRVAEPAQLAAFMDAARATGAWAVERVDEPSARQAVLAERVER